MSTQYLRNTESTAVGDRPQLENVHSGDLHRGHIRGVRRFFGRPTKAPRSHPSKPLARTGGEFVRRRNVENPTSTIERAKPCGARDRGVSGTLPFAPSAWRVHP